MQAELPAKTVENLLSDVALETEGRHNKKALMRETESYC